MLFRNVLKMAVDTLLDLMAESIISAAQNVGSVVPTVVPERFKFTEGDKVGAYPHPMAIWSWNVTYVRFCSFE